MSIRNLLQPRINELGKIKIGAKAKVSQTSSGGNQFRRPEKHDYFTITTLQRDKDGDLVPDARLMQSLANYVDADGKLRQIPVALLSNDIEDSLQAAFVWYVGKRLAGRSDGKQLELFHNRKTNEWFDHPRVEDWNERFATTTDSKGNLLFKLHTTLNVVIMSPEARWGGFYKFRTTSRISADQLYGSLVQIQALAYGQLRGMPLRLVVRPIQVSPSGKTTTVYVVHLDFVGSDLQAIQQQAVDRIRYETENRRAIQQTQQEYRRLLALPAYNETPQEHEDVAAEFHPNGLAEGEIPNGTVVDPLANQLGFHQQPQAEAPTTVAVQPITGGPVDDHNDGTDTNTNLVTTTNDLPDDDNPDDDLDDDNPLSGDGLFGNGPQSKGPIDALKG